MTEKQIIESLDKIIERFIERSKIFVSYSCYLPGLQDHLDNGESIRAVYDHEYLAFTKSARTLTSIRSLLEAGNNEDAYILLRSIFENYLAARYLNENVHSTEDISVLKEFIQNKIAINIGYLEVKNRKVRNSKGHKIAEIRNTISLVTGLDELYYKDFYAFLSRFTHLDFSILEYYIDESNSFKLKQKNDMIYARLFTVFTYTKLFECIVTIEDEEFFDENEERKCYELVRDSLLLQQEVFEHQIQLSNFKTKDAALIMKRDKLANMLKLMKESLKDDIGDFDKSVLF